MVNKWLTRLYEGKPMVNKGFFVALIKANLGRNICNRPFYA